MPCTLVHGLPSFGNRAAFAWHKNSLLGGFRDFELLSPARSLIRTMGHGCATETSSDFFCDR